MICVLIAVAGMLYIADIMGVLIIMLTTQEIVQVRHSSLKP
jgi:hypothetical protein